jgi:galactonate dehydratase
MGEGDRVLAGVPACHERKTGNSSILEPPHAGTPATTLKTVSSRRQFLHRCAGAATALAGFPFVRAANRSPSLVLTAHTLPDPDGHHAALKLKGDWVLLGISDGKHIGVGEISHSGDDAACIRRVRELFAAQFTQRDAQIDLEPGWIAALEKGVWATAPDIVTATAISGLNQALYDLVAQRAGVPVWRLLRAAPGPVQRELPCYLQLNRTLRARATPDFIRAVESARALGVSAVKITPFEAVTRGGGKGIAQSAQGFARLEAVRRAFPDLSLRVDCHERFTPEEVIELLPRFTALRLEWLEEPCPPGPGLAKVRAATSIPVATGELFFGDTGFRQLLESRWADVIMPDVKHVGGFGPLVSVCQLAEKLSGQVSPHNPSGPVATYASLHAAAVSPAVTSTELILTSNPERQPARELLEGGRLRIPEGPGWGIPEKISNQLRRAPVLAKSL